MFHRISDPILFLENHDSRDLVPLFAVRYIHSRILQAAAGNDKSHTTWQKRRRAIDVTHQWHLCVRNGNANVNHIEYRLQCDMLKIFFTSGETGNAVRSVVE